MFDRMRPVAFLFMALNQIIHADLIRMKWCGKRHKGLGIIRLAHPIVLQNESNLSLMQQHVD
jgi:hypothetical protein